MSDYKLAIKIAGELDGSLTSAVSEAKSLLQSLQDGAKGLPGMMGNAMMGGARAIVKGNAATLAAAGAAAAKIFKNSITEGMEFESAMADLAGTAAIEIGSEAYQQYEAAAREAGATTNKSSIEAAEALKYMALAGWDATDSIQALPKMIKLSSAANMDLAETSDLVTDSMGALGLSMADYNQYMDLVATADAAANYSAEEFMQTMIKSGGAARNLKMDLTSLAAMAGVLADNGLQGEAAGTAVNRMLQNMDSEKAKEAYAELNTSLYDAQGNFRGLEAVLGDLNSAFDGMSTEKVNGYMNSIFGAFAAQGRYLLEAQKSGQFQELVDQYGDVAGTLEERYNTATDTLKGDLDILKSAASDFGIEIYQSLNEGTTGLRDMVQEATETVNRLKEAFQLDGLDGFATQIGNEIANVATEIETNGATAIENATSFIENLYQSLGAEENADAIGGAASTILTSLATGFIETTGDYAVMAGNIISGLAKGFEEGDSASQIATALSGAIGKIGEWFEQDNGDLGAAAGSLIASLATQITSHADEIIPAGIQIIGGLVKGLIQGAAQLVGAAPTIIGNLLTGIMNSIPNLIEAGKGIAQAVKEGVTSVALDLNEIFKFDTDYGEVSAEVAEFASQNAEAVQTAVRDAWQSGLESGDIAMDNAAVQDFIQQWVEAGATVEEVQAKVDDVLSQPFSPDAGPIQSAQEVYNELVKSATETVQAQQEAAAAAEEMAAATESVGEAAESAGSATETLQSAIDSLGDGADAGLEGIAESLDQMASDMQEAQGAVDDLTSALSSDSFAGDLAEDLLSATDIEARAEEITTAMQSVSEGVSGSLESLQESFSSFGESVSSGLSSATEALSSFTEQVSSMVTETTAALDGIKDAAGTDTEVAGPKMQETKTPEIEIDVSGIQSAAEEASQAVETMASSVEGALSSVQSGFSGLGSAVEGSLSGVVASVQGFEQSITASVDGIKSAIESISSLEMPSQAAPEAPQQEFVGPMPQAQVEAPSMPEVDASSLTSSLESIASSVSTLVSEIEAQVSTLGTAFDTAFQSATTAFTSFDTSLASMASNISSQFSSVASSVSSAMATVASEVASQGAAAVASAQSTAAGIRGAFEGIDLSGVASQMMAGLTAGIQAGGAAAIAAAQSIASQIASAMSSALQIHSPSRVTYDIGANTGAGLTNALWDAVPDVTSASEALANATAKGVSGEQDQSPLSRFNTMSYPGADIMAGQQPQTTNQQQVSAPITFSPSITIQGNADQSQVQGALQWGFDQFEKMMQQYQWKTGREAFV